jgi:hypothetical protein
MPSQMPTSLQQLNPIAANLFRAINPSASGMLIRGNLIVFNYSMWVHDPYPLVLLSDVRPGQQIRGLNLHYLTFPFIKGLLRTVAGPMFSYGSIKGNKYLMSAFRSYKWNGVRQIKTLDTNFVLNVMATARSFDPNQIKAIRESVQEQINRVVNPPAVPTEPQPLQQVNIQANQNIGKI